MLIVDYKQRRLRLFAFALVKKMPAQTPRAKIAVLMRAYRKTPNKTYCSCPEGWWYMDAMWSLELSDYALQYFQVTCKSAVADMPPQKLQTFKANTSSAATEVYARWRARKKVLRLG